MSSRARSVDLLFVIAAIAAALLLRTIPSFDQVFRDGRVIFDANDPWIHMRNADNAAAHFPSPGWFDPYRLAPEGQWSEAPLMDWTIAGIAAVASGGRPSPYTLDRVGAWFPAIAGSLIVIPVFLLTRRLFDRKAARLAALLVAILPGQLLMRSMLGHTDHHVLEALLAAMVLVLLLRALEAGEESATADRRLLRKADALAALTGIALGAYLLAWSSGAFLVLILLAAGGMLIAASVSWETSSVQSARALAIAFGVALLLALPSILRLPSMSLNLPLLAGGGVSLVVLSAICDRMRKARVSRGRIVAAALVTLVLALGVAAAIPAVRESVDPNPRTFAGGGAGCRASTLQ